MAILNLMIIQSSHLGGTSSITVLPDPPLASVVLDLVRTPKIELNSCLL